jgi:hypothetical protein
VNLPALRPYPGDHASVVGDLRVLPGVHSPQLDRVTDLLDAAPDTLLHVEFDPDGQHGERCWAERLPDARRLLPSP